MHEAIGFMGLGQLGLPMAQNLIAAGHPLRVYNRTASKADALTAKGAQLAPQPIDTLTPGGIVISVLWDEKSVEEVVNSDGFLDRLGPGGVHISMSTILPEAAKRLAQLHAQHGCVYFEAPVFGRPEAAVARKLWMPIAGPRAALDRVRPILEAMGAQGIFDFGETVGAATTVKLAGNFLIGNAVLGLMEAINAAEKNGVDPKAFVTMLTTTLFPAPIYQSYGMLLAEKKAPMTQSEIAIKDLGLFKKTAAHADVQTPLANLLASLMKH